MSQKPVQQFTNSRLEDIKAEKYGPRLTTLANSFYAYRRRRRTISNLSGRVPSLSTKFSLEERTTYAMRPIADSSRTHGTRPDSGDSMPSAELNVRLLTPSFLIMLPPSSFLDLFSSHKVFHTVQTPRLFRRHYVCKQYLGASYSEAKHNYFKWLFAHHICVLFPYVPFLRHYMHQYDLRCGQAGLPGSCVYALRSR